MSKTKLSKIKIKLSAIVDRPVIQMVGNQPMTTGYQWINALTKLGDDPLPIKERYAIARTLEDVQRYVTSFEKLKDDVVKKLGVKTSDFLRGEIARLTKLGGQIKPAGLDQMRTRLAAIEKNPADDSWQIDMGNVEAKKKFEDEYTRLRSEEIELWLDHRVPLVSDSKLTSSEMLLLTDVLTEPV